MAGTAPRYGLSKFKNEAILYSPPQDSAKTYVFTIKRRGKTVTTWRCSTCDVLKNRNRTLGTVPTIKVLNGVFESDPSSPSHPHYCTPEETPKVLAYQVHREAVVDVKKSSKRPRAAHDDEVAKICQRYAGDHEIRNKVLKASPAYRKIRNSLYVAAREGIPRITSLDDIPDALSCTLAGATSTDPNDPRKGEKMVAFARNEPPTAYMACEEDFATLYQSEQWVGDGTFKCRPMDFRFSQLYVLLGYRNGEGVPSFHALTADRQEPTYVEMFQFLRSELIRRFGSIGCVTSVRFDFEDGAISAFMKVFPEVRVRGCHFHYAQAINLHVQKKGLQSVYNRTGQYAAPQYAGVKDWIRKLVALPLLPPYLVRAAWDSFLSKPPFTGDPHVDGCLTQFQLYFDRQWMTDRNIELANHFENPGGRTTNDAEGHNNRLGGRLGVHPKFNMFLHEFQKLHGAIQVRSLQLQPPNPQPPVHRNPQCVINDQRIQEAKMKFMQDWQNIPNDVYYDQNIDALINSYLNRVQHLIGSQQIA